MSDFSPAPPQDDQSVVPVAPFSIGQDVPNIEEDQSQDDIETTKKAQPYWHPAWESVQDRFESILEAYNGQNVVTYRDLPAEEFKVRVLAEGVVHDEIKQIMEDVKRAVESVDSRPKPGRRATKGG